MRIWQAIWTGSAHTKTAQLLLWGEYEKQAKAFFEAPPSTAFTQHPFCCNYQQLIQDLELIDFEADGKTNLQLLIPGSSSYPSPSPKLAGVLGQEYRDQNDLFPWTVDSLYFDGLPALAFLTSIPNELPQGLRLDDSLRFWIEATKFLLDLLTRGRFIPSIKVEDGSFFSQWELALSEEMDKERFEVLKTSMPCISRLPDAPTGETIEAEESLMSFLQSGAEQLIRLFLKSHSLLPEDIPLLLDPKRQAAKGFLTSLNRVNSEIEAPTKELVELHTSIQQWSSSLSKDRTRIPWKTCFKLVPPENSDVGHNQSWQVLLLLQSSKNTSDFLKLSHLWKGERGFLAESEQSDDDIEEHLLKDLGKATAVFPEISRALEQLFPESVPMSATEAYNFLQHTSPLLEKEEFAVMLPSWWQNRGATAGLHLNINSGDMAAGNPSSGLLGLQQLVDFSWEIAIGEEKFSIEEFSKLTASNAPLINIKGQWIEIKPGKLDATLQYINKYDSKSGLSLLQALRLGSDIESNKEILPMVAMSASGWAKKLLSIDIHNIEIPQFPKDFRGELRPYQIEGLSWLNFLSQLGIGGCLADDMGLGKTIQFLALLELERELVQNSNSHPQKHLPTLLIVPMSILDNWQNEAAKFAPKLATYLHHGPQRAYGKEFLQQSMDTDIVITTYALIHRDMELFKQVEWGRIALDEAQNIKNPSTKQSQAVRDLAYVQMTRSSSSTPGCKRVALTGTPLENHLAELWSILDFLNPGLLGSLEEFRRNYALPIERYRDSQIGENLTALVKPFILRRVKTDPRIVSDLPEKIEMEIKVNLTKEQAALYQSTVDETLPALENASGIHRKGLVLATITKLKQICNHPSLLLKDGKSLDTRSGKLSRLEAILDVVLAEGDKVLIFTQYAQMGALLKTHLQEKYDQEVLFLHGSQVKATRSRLIDKFQKPDGPTIFILSLKAGGFGLNLTQANQVVHFDQWWNPAVQEQATDRAYRIGQKRNVQVRTFVCKGTIEEKIAAMLSSKKELADSIVKSTRNSITEMNTSELKDLLSLGNTQIIDNME